MQQRLTLFGMARKIPGTTVLFHLRNMATKGGPTLYLAIIILPAAAHIIPAIPLKPSARIIFVNPPLLAPDRKWLARTHAKEIKLGVMFTTFFLLEFCFTKPISGEFLRAIAHVHAAKNPECEHLFGGQFGFKTGIKMLSCRFG